MNKTRLLPKMPYSAAHLWQLNGCALSVLMLSLISIGLADGILVKVGLGAIPWTVFAQGISLQLGVSIGWISALISALILLGWLPLGLRIGLGTLLNMLVIAFVLDMTVRYMPMPAGVFWRFGLGLLAIFISGVASAFYLTCALGAGPRDGLMVGLCQRFGWRVDWVRGLMEITVCALGYAMGATVGLITLCFALAVGIVLRRALLVLARFALPTLPN